MVAGTIISNDIIPLRTSDTGEEALAIMNEFGVRHLPIVNNKQLLGVISEDEILDYDIEEPIGSYRLSLIKPFVKENDHLFEVMKVMATQRLTVIPAISLEEEYIGFVTQEDLLQYFAATAAFTESGSIIVLELQRRDYSMVEIARIVESENANIISSFITTNSDAFLIDVTIKVNKPEIQHILATFERFNYKIKATFLEAQFTDTLKERYDLLMTYLNI